MEEKGTTNSDIGCIPMVAVDTSYNGNHKRRAVNASRDAAEEQLDTWPHGGDASAGHHDRSLFSTEWLLRGVKMDAHGIW